MLSIFTARHIPGLIFSLYSLSGIASCDPALMNVYARSRSPLINAFQRALIRSVTNACFASGARSLPPPDIEAQPARDAANDTANRAIAPCRLSRDAKDFSANCQRIADLMRCRAPGTGAVTAPENIRPSQRRSTATLERRLNKTLCIVNRFTPDLCTRPWVLHGRNIVAVAIWRRFMAFPAPA